MAPRLDANHGRSTFAPALSPSLPPIFLLLPAGLGDNQQSMVGD